MLQQQRNGEVSRKSEGVCEAETEITAQCVRVAFTSLSGPVCLSLDLRSLPVCVPGAGGRLAAVSLSVHLVHPEAHL